MDQNIILAIILSVVIGAVVYIFRRRQGKSLRQSHQTALGLGAVWISLGVIFKNSGIGALGGVMIVLGLFLWRQTRAVDIDS